jgi:uncharacterized protein (DUF2062 family)
MTAEAATALQAGKRGLWRRWIRDPVINQLTQGVSPEKIALTLAVGSALALFPILGTTTTLCLLAGILLGLNQPLIQAVNALCIVVYFPLILAFVRLGDALSGSARSALDVPLMVSTFNHSPRAFLLQFGTTALHAVLGWAVVAPAWIPVVYLAALRPLRAAARRIRLRQPRDPRGDDGGEARS